MSTIEEPPGDTAFVVLGLLVLASSPAGFLLMRRWSWTPPSGPHPPIWHLSVPLIVIGLYGTPVLCAVWWWTRFRASRPSGLGARLVLYALTAVTLAESTLLVWRVGVFAYHFWRG